jgi:hypothetical protein
MPPPDSKPKRVRTIRHLAIEERLEPRHREALRVLVLDPATRLVTVERWLDVMGCPSSPASVCRYRQHLQQEQRRRQEEEEWAEQEAARAVAYALAARDTPPAVFYRASVHLCQFASTLSTFCLRHLDIRDAAAAIRAYARATILLQEARSLLELAPAAPHAPAGAEGGTAA